MLVKFEELNLDSRLVEGLRAMQYVQLTPIQQRAIPPIFERRDIIATAQTGTGKTAAYLIPVLQNVLNNPSSHIDTLILVPTRELVLQIDQHIEGFSYFTNVSSIPVYGGGDGMAWEQQKKALRSKADIVVATPGRLLSHLASNNVTFDHLRHVVLDEADRMLDMGFYEDIIKIFNALSSHKQTLLFSATMPQKIKMMASKILINPVSVSVATAKPAEKIVQQAYWVSDEEKISLLMRLLVQDDYSSVIIFVSTKSKVKKLDTVLRKKSIPARAFHSDLNQADREDILRQFTNKEFSVIVGTNILSRGIDIEGIDLVVNFDVPSDPEDYIHRIGRTARADRSGVAITLINEMDRKKNAAIEELLGYAIPKVELPVDLKKTRSSLSRTSGMAFAKKRNRHFNRR